MPSIDWAQMFIPSGNVLELIIRGTILYLGLLFFLRVLRREAGELNRADLLVVILVADAVRDGRISGRHLRAEMITRDDLMEQLREQGVESVSEVKRCFLESDGRLSVIRKASPGEATPRKQQATV